MMLITFSWDHWPFVDTFVIWCTCSSLLPIKTNWLFIFLVLSCRSSLCISDISLLSDICVASLWVAYSFHVPTSVDILSPLSNISCSHQLGFLVSFPECHAQLWVHGSTLPLVGCLATAPSPSGSLSPVSSCCIWCSSHSSLHATRHLVYISALNLEVLSHHLDVSSLRTGNVSYFFLTASVRALYVQIVQSRNPLNRRLWRRSSFSFLAEYIRLFATASCFRWAIESVLYIRTISLPFIMSFIL